MIRRPARPGRIVPLADLIRRTAEDCHPYLLIPHDSGQEVPDFLLGGVFEEGFGRAVLEDLAFGEEDDFVGDGAGESHFVGGEDDLLASLAEVVDELEHFGGHLGVERRGGFVENEEVGLVGDGASQGDTLLLAAGHLRRHLVRVAGKSESREGFLRDGGGFFLAVAVHFFQRKRDVLESAEVGEEVEGLEEESVGASVGEERGLGEIDRLARDFESAGVGRFEAAEDAEKRGLAAAGGADEGKGANIVRHVESDVL